MSFSLPVKFTVASVSERDDNGNVVTREVDPQQRKQLQTNVQINGDFFSGLRDFLRQLPGNDESTIDKAIGDFFGTDLPKEESATAHVVEDEESSDDTTSANVVENEESSEEEELSAKELPWEEPPKEEQQVTYYRIFFHNNHGRIVYRDIKSGSRHFIKIAKFLKLDKKFIHALRRKLLKDYNGDANRAEQFISEFLEESYVNSGKYMDYTDFYDYWDTFCYYKDYKNGKEFKRVIIRDYTEDEEFSVETNYSNSEHECGRNNYSADDSVSGYSFSDI